jgi:hypothetical protein
MPFSLTFQNLWLRRSCHAQYLRAEFTNRRCVLRWQVVVVVA